MFSLLGFLPDEPIFSHKLVHTILSSLFFLVMIVCLVSSIVFVVDRLKVGDYQNCLYAGIQIAGISTSIPTFISMVYHQEKVRDVIGGFQQIFVKCKCAYLFTDYEISWNVLFCCY